MIRVFVYPTPRGWQATCPLLGIGARDYDRHECVRICRREVETCTPELIEVVEGVPPENENEL
jgi:hypothetical protein